MPTSATVRLTLGLVIVLASGCSGGSGSTRGAGGAAAALGGAGGHATGGAGPGTAGTGGAAAAGAGGHATGGTGPGTPGTGGTAPGDAGAAPADAEGTGGTTSPKNDGGLAGHGAPGGTAGTPADGGTAAGHGGSAGAVDAGAAEHPGSDAGSSATASRPAYNTGTGFFTLNGRLYDANGVELHIEGVNATHYDANWAACSSNCGIPNARANVNRIGMPLWSAIPAQTLQGLMNLMISQHVIPMPGVWYVDGSYADSSNVTCQESAAAGSTFQTAVDQWVARAALFKPYEKTMLLNIANEWGPVDSAVWRDTYVAAVAKLRAAGYRCTLVIDAGGCGQDVADLVKYAQAVYDADPQHNILFDQHIYGQWSSKANGAKDWQTDLTTGLDQLKATGLPILVGEFGPGKNIGASPTPLTPGSIIQAANARGFGWLAWAWDDGYGDGDNGFELSNSGAFSLTGGTPTNGAYPHNTDLSAFGNDVVLNPTYGTFATAHAATVF